MRWSTSIETPEPVHVDRWCKLKDGDVHMSYFKEKIIPTVFTKSHWSSNQ